MRILRTRSRRTLGLAAAVLVLGLTGGAAASTGLALATDNAGSAELSLREEGVRAAVSSVFQRYADTIHDLVAVAGTAALPTTVDRIAGDRLAGAHEVLVIGADRTVLARHEVDGSTLPAAASLSPEPELDRAMALAGQHGRLVASPAHVLPADAGLSGGQRQQGFELAAPIPPGGWVVVSVRAADLLESALRGAGLTGVRANLTEISPDGVLHDVAHWSQGGPPLGGESRVLDLPIAGHTWQLTIRPTTALTSFAARTAAPAVMIVTALASLGLAALILAAGDRRPPAAQERAREYDDGELAPVIPLSRAA